MFLTCLLLAALIPTASQSQSPRPQIDLSGAEPHIGKITGFEEDGQVALVKVGPKTHRITNALTAARLLHSVKTIAKLQSGMDVHVLCRFQERVNGEGTGDSLDEQYASISAIVQGPFRPPALTKKQKLAKLKWKRGVLQQSGKGTRHSLDGVNMQVGIDKIAFVVTPGPNTPLKKGSLVRVWSWPEATPATDDKKEARRLGRMIHSRAGAVELLARRAPNKDYAIVLGTAK